MQKFKELCYFWISAYLLAALGYYFLRFFINHPFGSWYRMFCYHSKHPLQYISIVVFVYGIVSIILNKHFQKSKHKILFSVFIALITILFASPFGGILWHFHDMQAGWFPKNWINKLFGGFIDGLQIGWLLILRSFPYNILGLIINYYILKYVQKINENLFRSN